MYKHFFKRFFDFWVALFFVLLSSPLLIVTTIWLHYANKGAGAWFLQERPGLHGKIFKIIKFKTMTDERDAEGNLLPDEARLTKVGKIVRKTSLDELPQLINVLKGDMSLVGPRPELPHFVEQFRETIPYYMVKHQVKPGMTGWAQVNGLRGDTSIEERIEKDLWYIEHWSPWLDLRILFKTFFGGAINAEKIK